MNGRTLSVIAATILFTAGTILPGTAPAAERKTQKAPPPSARESASAVNDSNVQTLLKKTDEQLKKNDFIGTLGPTMKINDFAKDVLASVKTVRAYYEKAINDPATPQNDKETLFLKLRGLEQVEGRYNVIYETTTYNLGYIYAKRGDAEKGRKYLSEYIKITPFSAKKDSKWMKAKTLLLELYGLEGEF